MARWKRWTRTAMAQPLVRWLSSWRRLGTWAVRIVPASTGDMSCWKNWGSWRGRRRASRGWRLRRSESPSRYPIIHMRGHFSCRKLCIHTMYPPWTVSVRSHRVRIQIPWRLCPAGSQTHSRLGNQRGPAIGWVLKTLCAWSAEGSLNGGDVIGCPALLYQNVEMPICQRVVIPLRLCAGSYWPFCQSVGCQQAIFGKIPRLRGSSASKANDPRTRTLKCGKDSCYVHCWLSRHISGGWEVLYIIFNVWRMLVVTLWFNQRWNTGQAVCKTGLETAICSSPSHPHLVWRCECWVVQQVDLCSSCESLFNGRLCISNCCQPCGTSLLAFSISSSPYDCNSRELDSGCQVVASPAGGCLKFSPFFFL